MSGVKGISSGKKRRSEMFPLPLLDENAVLEAFEHYSIKPNHAQTIWRHFVQNGTTNIRDIPDLPKKAYDLIESDFAIVTSKVVKESTSSDGATTKLMVELHDGRLVESVIMRYGRTEFSSFPKDVPRRTDEDGNAVFRCKERATLCISSQVGCQMGCTFCATGTMGLVDNLTAGEILEQLYHANKVEKIRNVVFMGMGEPLDNYDAVIAAIRGMIDVQRFSLSPSRISVSTVGVHNRIRSLVHDAPGVSLALSLHAPTQELRTQIVPSSKAFPVDKIMSSVDYFIGEQRKISPSRSVVVCEYVLIADINDSVEVAHQVGQLLKDRPVMLNVIPYNPTDVPFDYKPPSNEDTHKFCDTVREYGIRVILRQELGQDISSACGQLVVSSINNAASDGKSQKVQPPQDLEDLFDNQATTNSNPRREINLRKRKGKASSSGSSTVGASKTTTDDGEKQATGDRTASHNNLSSPVMIFFALLLVFFVAKQFLQAS